MNETYKKYCDDLINSGQYSKCFIQEASTLYCPDMQSMKRLINMQSETRGINSNKLI